MRKIRIGVSRKRSSWCSTGRGTGQRATGALLVPRVQSYNLDLPVKQSNGDTAWRRPSYSAIHRIIENPVYGGANAYGKTAVAAGYTAEGVSVKIRRKTRNEWLTLEPNTHERYVNWERFEAIRAMVSSKVPTGWHHRAPQH